MDAALYNKKYENLVEYLEKLPLSKEIKDKIADKNFIDQRSPLYFYYPEVYKHLFKKVDNHTIDLLCIAGFLYFRSIIEFDYLLDNYAKGDVNRGKEAFAIGNICQEEAIKLLSSLFPLESSFWQYWNKRKIEFLSALYINAHPESIKTFADYENYADKKSAFGKIAIDSLYVLNGEQDNEIYHELLNIHTQQHIANQILDDYNDFKEDFINGQINIYNIELLKYLKKTGDNKEKDIVTLYKLLHITGIAEKILEKSWTYLQYALDKSKKNELKIYEIVINGHIFRIKNITTHIKMYNKSIEIQLLYKKAKKQSLKAELILKKQEGIIEEIAISMFNLIYNQWKDGYGEIQHIFYMPKDSGYKTDKEFHYADIFQRAIIAEILCDSREVLGESIQLLIDFEIDYLISNIASDYPQAWRYTPTLDELPPDADDLGQIMQLFAKSCNLHLVKEYCQTGIDVLLNERTNDDGGIETWIVPKKNLTEVHKRQEELNKIWGIGPDNEVMANFLYGLVLFNLDNYATIIYKSCKYLASKQNIEGYWDSKWYYGKYYGTYVCSRLFIAIKRENGLLQRSLKFLLITQNKDGGWGHLDKSDPLNTCFALITLIELQQYLLVNEDIVLDKIEAGINYITENYHNGTLVKGISFIRPRLHDTFLCKTLTCAYVLKTCCKIINFNAKK